MNLNLICLNGNCDCNSTQFWNNGKIEIEKSEKKNMKSNVIVLFLKKNTVKINVCMVFNVSIVIGVIMLQLDWHVQHGNLQQVYLLTNI